jgi:hypothetical protein
LNNGGEIACSGATRLTMTANEGKSLAVTFGILDSHGKEMEK